MSLKYEQYRSLYLTKNFLHDLIAGDVKPTKGELKRLAYQCARHFPPLDKTGRPIFSGDPFPTPNLHKNDLDSSDT